MGNKFLETCPKVKNPIKINLPIRYGLYCLAYSLNFRLNLMDLNLNLSNNLDYMDVVKKEFVSCHYCFTYYCSKLCQKQHAALHKNKCVYLKAIRNTISIHFS